MRLGFVIAFIIVHCQVGDWIIYIGHGQAIKVNLAEQKNTQPGM
jgi:hypothetical protein